MPELIEPTMALRDSWLESSREWGAQPQHGSGLHETDEVGTVEGFTAWIERLKAEGDETRELAPGRVPAAYWWIVDDGNYAGAITLRYRLNEKLLDGGGHIGYGVRPSARGRGLASWALGAVLDRARARGLDRVLVTCDDGNLASARTIERNGGVLEDVRETWLGITRRYWIAL
ncbi:GNAT family N-acetyltransferase [Kribbella sp. ALI-6-A]|uniref:GNAT family N-acetyltransferase n=1 Tax=Kribbella sp. ALI-6-A TaxID=1933817 RepID=UPI00097CB855|nr:GNAT family N-acetyltransferase [Kribbella sp. ALI-6-A]ONI70038.1 GNAT family N-acetyltransferase [Kribbella sp. ALI-6-A]